MSKTSTRKSFIEYELPTEDLEKVQGGKPGQMTTLALGEEGGGLTTRFLGEECGGPPVVTTFVVGEESGSR